LAHLWPEVCPIILNFTLGMPLGLEPLQANNKCFVFSNFFNFQDFKYWFG